MVLIPLLTTRPYSRVCFRVQLFVFQNWVVAMIERSGIIRLKGWQQAAVAVGSAVGALLDPRRADLIAALGETTGKPAFDRVLERMKKSPEGRVRPFLLYLFQFIFQLNAMACSSFIYLACNNCKLYFF